MEKYYYFIWVIIIAIFAYSDNSISIDSSVNTFVYGFEKRDEHIYRTGLLKGKDRTFDLDVKKTSFGGRFKEKDNINDAWHSYDTIEYDADFNSGMEELKAIIKKIFNDTLISYNTYDNEFIINFFDNDKDSLGNDKNYLTEPNSLPLEELFKIGKKCLHRYFNNFAKKIEFNNYEVTYICPANDESHSKIHELKIIFRRIFNGGVVLGDASYICLLLNGQGELFKVLVKWPVFEAIENYSTAREICSTFDKTKEIFKHVPELISNNEGGPYKVTNAEIKGMALGWLPLYKDSLQTSMIITPAYSFIVKLTIDIGDTVFKQIEIPRLMKYELYE